jgi:hypothetical protein
MFLPSEQSSEREVVFLGDDKPVRLKPLLSANRQKRTSISRSHSSSVQEGDDEGSMEQPGKQQQQQQQQQHLKRGHRGKLKKIKEKYKYQDEEERKLRMEILQVGPLSGSVKYTGQFSGRGPQINNYESCSNLPMRLKFGKYILW